MAVSRVGLLAELDGLSEDQIESGLAEGFWEEPTRSLVEHYLDQMRQQRTDRKLSEQIAVARKLSKSAVDKAAAAEEEASGASLRANAALVIAAGAIFAAMASALVAFIALQK